MKTIFLVLGALLCLWGCQINEQREEDLISSYTRVFNAGGEELVEGKFVVIRELHPIGVIKLRRYMLKSDIAGYISAISDRELALGQNVQVQIITIAQSERQMFPLFVVAP